MLQCQNLAPITQRVSSKQFDVREAVEDNTMGLQLFDCVDDELDSFSKFRSDE